MKLLKKIYFPIIAFFVLTSCSTKRDIVDADRLTFVFYNVENLFDLKNEPGKNDEEFTPGGRNKWDSERYNKKLLDVSDVLSGVNKYELPEIIGLCEVENKKVVKDLMNTGKLAMGNYKVIHYESPDSRGIDCAFAYRPNEFTVLSHDAISVEIKTEPGYSTRDILHVKGRANNDEEFHIFVNHWPSRNTGKAKTESRRMDVAELLKNEINAVLIASPKANIVVMGDLNDEPTDHSLNEVLNAGKPGSGKVLVNLMYPDDEKGLGSYNFRGNWNMLDNIIVSAGLLDTLGFRCTDKKGYVYRKPWMEYENRDGQFVPNRTYGGPNYYGGISDHFPVYFQLEK